MRTLKEKLLGLDICKDNEYLDLYCLLIVNNKGTKQIKGQTQKHHIIPRAYYKLHNLKLDNSKENLVNLSIMDHIKAHIYLMKSASCRELQSSAAAAIRYMCDLFAVDDLLNNKEDIELAYKLNSDKAAKEMSDRRKTGWGTQKCRIRCIETDQIFETILEAQQWLGKGNIKQVLKGISENAAGYHFEYVDKPTPKYIAKCIRFTEEDLAILKEKYPLLGSKIPELRLKFSFIMLNQKAYKLGIKKTVE